MELSQGYADSILLVKVALVFSGFEEDPDEITQVLGLQPDQVLRQGEIWATHPAQRTARENQWALDSRSDSKDVNDQIRDILSQLSGREDRIRPSWNPLMDVIWKGDYLYAGSGPQYDADVIQGIARLGAELGQDIYQVDEERTESGQERAFT